MNTKVLKTLEYDKIKEAIKPFLRTAPGQSELAELHPSTKSADIEKWLNETQDAVWVTQEKGGVPLYYLADITEPIQRLEKEAVLSATELSLVRQQLNNAQLVVDFFEQLISEEIDLPLVYLPQLADHLVVLHDLNQTLQNALQDNGHFNDQASNELQKIRSTIREKEAKVKDLMQGMARGKQSRYLAEPLVTMRANRYVLPVKAEYRRQFGGTVHDQSQTGQTLYIEPEAAMRLNDEIHELQVDEQSEITRLLWAFSNELRPYTKELANNAKLLGRLDFANAKARYAVQMKATRPLVNDDKAISLNQAWHPLLDMDKAVKNDIELGVHFSALLITGPNTGGKTITIKTVGLLQLMAQSGLFITAADKSQVGVFEEVFADIGDEQSIEQSLSTFSAHMVNIIDILQKVDDQSLVIFDELGAGTDPQEGAGLAMAIIDQVMAAQSRIIVTTHYPELKVYADDRDQIFNASMIFDVATLSPTYQLVIGVPGQSNALDIARQLGLNEQVVQAAESLVDEDSRELNHMIADLVQRRDDVVEQQEQLAQQIADNQNQSETLADQLAAIDKQKAQAVLDGKNEANRIVAKAKAEADQLIKELRQANLHGGKSSLNEQDLQRIKKNVDGLREDVSLEKNRVLRRAKKAKALHPGDEVFVRTYHQRGELVSQHKDGQWEVQLGILKLLVDEADIKQTPAEQQPEKKPAKKPKFKAQVSAAQRAHASLDLRGVRYEDAMMRVDRYLDEAVLANLGTVEIIHGRGTGALRQGVAELLRGDSRVAHFEFANANAGGDGATLVTLK